MNLSDTTLSPISNYIVELDKNHYSKKNDKKFVDNCIKFIDTLLNERNYYKHKAFTDCFNVSQAFLYEIFTQGYTRRKILNSTKKYEFNNLFQKVHHGNSLDGFGNSAYKMTDYLTRGISKWMIANRDQALSNLISITPDGITSNVIISTEKIMHRLDNLYIYLKYLSQLETDFYFPDLNFFDDNLSRFKGMAELDVIQEIRVLFNVINMSVNDQLVLNYKESNAGRYYGVGCNHLQGAKKHVREMVLDKYFSYDIESSAPVILAQLYEKITGKNVPQSIQYYIDNKTEFRKRLAAELNIDINMAKSIFTMLFFGSRTNKNDNFEFTALCKMLGKNNNNALLNSAYFEPLVRDVKMIFKMIGEVYKTKHSQKIGEEWNVTNTKQKVKKLTTWNNGKVVSFVYQGIESQILDICLDYYNTKYADNASYLMIHDGFYSLHELSIDELESLIEEKLGYKIKFTPAQSTLTQKQIAYAFKDKNQLAA